MHTSKLDYVEILKIVSICFVILLHVFGIFAFPTITYIKDPSINNGLLTMMARPIWRCTMSLMFFLSGIGAYHSLKKRTVKQFLFERLKRLYVPLVFVTLSVVSVQTYILATTSYGFKGSFFDFFPKVFFNGIGLGPTGYFNWGHLWFISYLFHISLLALPLFIYFLKDEKPYIIQVLLKVVQKGSIVLPLLLLVLIEIFLRPIWPGKLDLIHDWANFASFFVWFVYGFIYAGDFLKLKTHNTTFPFFFVMYVISLIVTIPYLGVLDSEKGYHLNFILSRALVAVNAWACIVFLMDFGRTKFNF
jgi:hypothetical protein